MFNGRLSGTKCLALSSRTLPPCLMRASEGLPWTMTPCRDSIPSKDSNKVLSRISATPPQRKRKYLTLRIPVEGKLSWVVLRSEKILLSSSQNVTSSLSYKLCLLSLARSWSKIARSSSLIQVGSKYKIPPKSRIVNS